MSPSERLGSKHLLAEVYGMALDGQVRRGAFSDYPLRAQMINEVTDNRLSYFLTFRASARA